MFNLLSLYVYTYIRPNGGGRGRNLIQRKALRIEEELLKCSGKSGCVKQDAGPKPVEREEIEGLTPPYPAVHSQTYYSKAVQFIHCLVTRL